MKKSTKTRRPSSTSTSACSEVRIIGGQLKRRNVSFIAADGLRPTPDRLRETLFNWLMGDLYEARVLDACAGSGVLGFEALSRGAIHCTFIEANAAQYAMLQKNAESLRLDSHSYLIAHAPAEQYLTSHAPAGSDAVFDVIFLDPPYAANLWQPILDALLTQDCLAAHTLLYVEADRDTDVIMDEWCAKNADILSKKQMQTPICLKQTKVGQVMAGLYQLGSS
ncbi:16S rRNA (guanine(966)-N(2))-methyltransferase RsmD [Psychrobacter aestuarii]|uniref:Ribosomal RNA small subunit methyltransferase D n=1 Tax=Psychrobacter aestuarii TaxID=556327 RepID=A0ABP3FP07_9GAMM|nr:16S rRNA (guanine(966)-N(2))-methyltransferase RsmD [Psychrobacter aestuarii]